MAGGSMGDAPSANAPWVDYSSTNQRAPVEIGCAPRVFLNMGPGVCRIQPFAAGTDNTTILLRISMH